MATTPHENELLNADALCRLTPGIVLQTSEATGTDIRIDFNTGALVIHPTKEEIFTEIAGIHGFADRAWMVWRPDEDSFEDLA
ncbi:hypothetical protein JHV56_05170 [Arthrobacter sp. BHU FT2]|nr:hypothetical protein [Arthrobacter sp. BHU FT2]